MLFNPDPIRGDFLRSGRRAPGYFVSSPRRALAHTGCPPRTANTSHTQTRFTSLTELGKSSRRANCSSRASEEGARIRHASRREPEALGSCTPTTEGALISRRPSFFFSSSIQTQTFHLPPPNLPPLISPSPWSRCVASILRHRSSLYRSSKADFQKKLCCRHSQVQVDQADQQK